jgi:Cu/Ag efflux protein CusF
MIKKLVVASFLLGAVVLVSGYAFAEDVTGAAETAIVEEDMLPAEEGVGEGVITGEVTVLDASAGSITIKGEDSAEKAFSVIDGETILWKGIEDIKLSDIKKGDKAEVGYYTSDAGKLVASWVDVLVPEAPAAAGVQTEAMPDETVDEE